MSYAQIDDKILDCPQALESGEEATDLYIRATIFCNAHLTDGRVPKAALSRLSGKPHRAELVAELVRTGWWLDVGDAWMISDYLERNPSRAVVLERRRKAAERTERWRAGGATKKRAPTGGASAPRVTPPHGDASGDASRDASQDALATRTVTAPSPLLSDPLIVEPPPVSPSAGAAGETPAAPDPPKRRRAKRERPPSPEVDAVRAEVQRLVGITYPDSAWDGLRAELGKGATLDDALAYVRWAATQDFEGRRLELNPVPLFRAGAFAAGLARARRAGSPIGPPARASPPPGRPTPRNEYEQRMAAKYAQLSPGGPR